MSRLNVISEATESQSELDLEIQSEPKTGADLEAMRAQLRDARGVRYWRSLEELAGTPAFSELLHREFPRFAAEWQPGLDRRRFLQLSSASLALAGLTGCTKQPHEEIVPYVNQPEQIVPGKPLYFATNLQTGGYAVPVLAESHMGRPTKLEGNPEHPASLGGSDVFTQASVLDLYDPDRLTALVQLGQIRTWSAFVEAMGAKMQALRALGGEGLRVLSGPTTSPTLGGLLERLLGELPKARWHQYQTATGDAARSATRAAFGAALEGRYDLAAADIVVALDSDFLTEGPGAVRYAKDFARRRKVDDVSVDDAGAHINRLYTVDSAPTATSTAADHRLALGPTGVAHFAAALAAKLGVAGVRKPTGLDGASAKWAKWVDAVAADLLAHRGRSLVITGEHLDADVHVLAHAINHALGNVGYTVLFSEPITVEPVDQMASLRTLVDDMNAGSVDTLLVLGANPVYDAPADLDVAAAMDKVPLNVFLGQRVDETGALCQWQVPEAHALESWSDGRAFDGSVSLGQPLIQPLYGGKSAIELIATLLGESTIPADELVRRTHVDFDDAAWRRALHDGFIADSVAPAVAVTLRTEAVEAAAATVVGKQADGLELSFRLDPSVYDGRFANNAWLQECPKPLTKLTWDNALLMSPRTARDLGLGDLFDYGDQRGQAPMVRLAVGERSLDVPVWGLPGHADGAMTLHLGYGRTRCGHVGEGTGFDASMVRSSDAPWTVARGVAVTPIAGDHYLLASTQDHHSMEGRDLIRTATLDAYRADPYVFEHGHHGPGDISLMDGKDFPYDGYAWGMSIDLNACTGCNACVVACQAENNIPTVGKDQVAGGREMHWIRVDRYFAGNNEDEVSAYLHQPVACMQCEQAPCEVVCPVAATVHSDEGLNDMVYNRCVGTRYCSNNCPYKVRRFNFFLYSDFETPSLQLGRNPDVTIRSRGVMEKCSYCVQRINHARIDAKREDRKINDGEIVTACQGACPSEAITFGDINDHDSAVAKAKSSPRDYGLLAELGTRPRTTYLARIRHPNVALEPAGPATGGHGSGGHGSGGHGSGDPAAGGPAAGDRGTEGHAEEHG